MVFEQDAVSRSERLWVVKKPSFLESATCALGCRRVENDVNEC
jgi:hypothetical protein